MCFSDIISYNITDIANSTRLGFPIEGGQGGDTVHWRSFLPPPLRRSIDIEDVASIIGPDKNLF